MPGLEGAILDIGERESKTRLKLISEGMKLKAGLEMFRFPDKARRRDHASSPSVRFARQFAAAMLAIGIPATAGCGQSQDKDVKTPPPQPAPTPYYGISEMAAYPLKEGQEPPLVTPDQQNLCSLTGIVTDPQRAVVRNVTITITNADTKQTRTLKTNDAGQYEAKDLPEGRYSVKAEEKNFKTTIVNDVVLKAGDRQRTDIRLEIGNFGGCCEYAASPLKA